MLLFNTNENTILTLGFTFPSLVFLSGLAFVPLGYLYAPVAASIVMICGLFYQLLEEFKKFNFFGLNPDFRGVTGEKLYNKMSEVYATVGLVSGMTPAWRTVIYPSILKNISSIFKHWRIQR